MKTDTIELDLNLVLTEEESLVRRIDEILFYIWDPLNLSTTNWVRHEYHLYLPEVVDLAKNGASQEQLCLYLSNIAEHHMKVWCDDKCKKAALVIHRVTSDFIP